MNQFLKKAVERYTFGDFKINPISEVDAEIIVELKEMLNKAGLKGANQILANYKFLKDTEIRDALLQWNIDNPVKSKSELPEEKSAENKSYFLNIGGHLISPAQLYGIYVDYEGLKIVLNPSTTERYNNPYSNLSIPFDSEESIDEFVLNLKELLNIEIINL